MKKDTNIFNHDASLSLKGIAIIMLLFHHIFRSADCYEGFAISFFPFAEIQVNTLAEDLRICVPIFAFISGYGLFLNYKKKYRGCNASNWCLYRYIKTFSGYWFVWMLVAVLFQIINGRTFNILLENGKYTGFVYALIDFSGLARLFDTPTLCGTWWYMSAAFTFIIITPLIYLFRKNLLLVLLAFVVFPRVIFGRSGESIYLGSVAIYTHMTSFMLGAIFARHKLFDWWLGLGCKDKAIKAYKLITELWLIVIGYMFFNNIPRDRFWEYHFGFYPVLIILFAVEFIFIIPCIKRFLCFFGKYSMNMYFTHSLLQWHYPELFYTKKHFAVIAICFVGLSLLLSLVIELLKKITKYNDFVNRIDSMVLQKVKIQ